MTSYQTSPPVYFGSKYISITLFAKILLINNKNLPKTVMNVCKSNVYLFLAIPGVQDNFGRFWDNYID